MSYVVIIDARKTMGIVEAVQDEDNNLATFETERECLLAMAEHPLKNEGPVFFLNIDDYEVERV